jgi:hypothetical protein
MSGRTFIVRVSESPPRVVIEDVRTQRRAVRTDLNAVGGQIADWLRDPKQGSGVAPPSACRLSDSHGKRREEP